MKSQTKNDSSKLMAVQTVLEELPTVEHYRSRYAKAAANFSGVAEIARLLTKGNKDQFPADKAYFTAKNLKNGKASHNTTLAAVTILEQVVDERTPTAALLKRQRLSIPTN
jgi:hypothetical protein